MKIIKDSLAVLVTLVLSIGAYTPALALDAGVSVDGSVSVSRSSDDKEEVSSKASTSVRVESDDREEGTSSRAKASSTRDSRENGTSTATSTNSRSEGDEHRSAVATFVQNLLKIADRDGGIGAQVRVVAKEQNDSASTTTDAIVKVETRSAFKTFLIGSDYKSLGAIRSELAKTDTRIEKLSALASSTTNVQVRTQLNAQIKLLQADQAKVTAFVDAHESAFSLFGWFVKAFTK